MITLDPQVTLASMLLAPPAKRRRRQRPQPLAIPADEAAAGAGGGGAAAVGTASGLGATPSAARAPLPSPAASEINLNEQGMARLSACGPADVYGAASWRGTSRRWGSTEDTYSALPALSAGGELRVEHEPSFYGVFDGHGGRAAADYCAQHLHGSVFGQACFPASVGDALRAGFSQTDTAFVKLARQGGASCGTAAVAAVLHRGVLTVAHCGDCRAVLAKAGAPGVALTEDHRASRSDERRRIEAQGGSCICMGQTWRVDGHLAVSRAIGYEAGGAMKKYVVPDPDTVEHAVGRDDEFVLLGSDGLWDVIGSGEAVEIARGQLGAGGTLEQAASALSQRAVERGSRDDVTVVAFSLTAVDQ